MVESKRDKALPGVVKLFLLRRKNKEKLIKNMKIPLTKQIENVKLYLDVSTQNK